MREGAPRLGGLSFTYGYRYTSVFLRMGFRAAEFGRRVYLQIQLLFGTLCFCFVLLNIHLMGRK